MHVYHYDPIAVQAKASAKPRDRHSLGGPENPPKGEHLQIVVLPSAEGTAGPAQSPFYLGRAIAKQSPAQPGTESVSSPSRATANDRPDKNISRVATAFAQRVHEWAVANYEPRLNMFSVVLTADATTYAHRQRLAVHARQFAARFEMNDEGAWLTMETGEDGHHHVNGLLITELELEEVFRLWGALVTTLRTHRRAQWGKRTPCSTKDWRTAKGLPDQIDGWACYSMKAEKDGRDATDKVLAATGQLRDAWSNAVLAAHASTDACVRRCENCCAPLRGKRSDARFCGGRCRGAAAEKRTRSRRDALPAVVHALLHRGPLTKATLEQDLDYTRACVRGACELLAHQGAVRRTRRGWVLVDRVVSELRRSDLWAWGSDDTHFEGNAAARNHEAFS